MRKREEVEKEIYSMISSRLHLAVRSSRLSLHQVNVKNKALNTIIWTVDLRFKHKNTSLASATVARRIDGWLMQVVDVVSSTVLYIYVSGPVATVDPPVKTHCSVHSTLTNIRMNSTQPAWHHCTTTVRWHAALRHLWSRCSWESVPVVYREVIIRRVTSASWPVIVKLGAIRGIEEWIGITGIWKRRWKEDDYYKYYQRKRSSQLWSNLRSYKQSPEKILRLQRDGTMKLQQWNYNTVDST